MTLIHLKGGAKAPRNREVSNTGQRISAKKSSKVLINSQVASSLNVSTAGFSDIRLRSGADPVPWNSVYFSTSGGSGFCWDDVESSAPDTMGLVVVGCPEIILSESATGVPVDAGQTVDVTIRWSCWRTDPTARSEASVQSEIGSSVSGMAHLSYFESKDKEEAILKVYDQIKQLDTIYDSIVLENIICGLSTTSSWSEGLELVKSAIVNPSHQTFLYLITAAFKNGDFATGLGYFPEICANSTISEQAALAFLDSLEANSTESNQSKINIVNDFCQVLGKTGIISTKNIITKLKSLIHSTRGTSHDNHVHVLQAMIIMVDLSCGSHGVCRRDSKCSHCWKSLHPKIFTEQEFNELREAVLKNLVMEKNIFMNTTPAEFKNFVTFINRNKPFDVVFDGLNLLYCQRHERKADMRISLFVNHYATREKKKVLVLGRNHMNKLNYKVMEEIRKIAHVYLLQNVSQDDAMFIYAAMMSGPQTYILTKDMLRNHLEKMPTPELKQSFSAWQATRQIIPAFFPTDTKVPPPHLITAQGSLTTGLHVPYGQAEDCYDYVKSWLCVQPK
ncbi:KIAA0391 [Cordylochernes scorpioides]|uniref:ribonuclease P n=1 Tax=Cordylochernes scorpioides TaxID=51811 RepID=A0ABY6K5W5_9ARAC|nr:KIAA0391 [Cordylochernes scorpioides]